MGKVTCVIKTRLWHRAALTNFGVPQNACDDIVILMHFSVSPLFAASIVDWQHRFFLPSTLACKRHDVPNDVHQSVSLELAGWVRRPSDNYTTGRSSYSSAKGCSNVRSLVSWSAAGVVQAELWNPKLAWLQLVQVYHYPARLHLR
jgi:hypothetical protein